MTPTKYQKKLAREALNAKRKKISPLKLNKQAKMMYDMCSAEELRDISNSKLKVYDNKEDKEQLQSGEQDGQESGDVQDEGSSEEED